MAKDKEREYTFLRVGPDIKANGKMVINKDMVVTIMLEGINMKDIL